MYITKKAHTPSPLPSTSSFEKWQRPPPEWIKINTDAAIIKGVGTRLGWVARDCERKVLVAGVQRRRSKKSLEPAKGVALRWALGYASLNTWEWVIIESDALGWISRLQCGRKVKLNRI